MIKQLGVLADGGRGDEPRGTFLSRAGPLSGAGVGGIGSILVG
jgi:hypothetical protein